MNVLLRLQPAYSVTVPSPVRLSAEAPGAYVTVPPSSTHHPRNVYPYLVAVGS